MNKEPVGDRFEIIILAALLINGSYLLGRGDATVFYLANIVVHVLAGIVLSVVWLRYARAWFHKARRDRDVISWARALTPLAAMGTGLILIVTGRLYPFHVLYVGHILLAYAATFLVFTSEYKYGETSVKRLILASALVAFALQIENELAAPPLHDSITNNRETAASMAEENALGENSPFFPSAVEVLGGGLIPESFFLGSQTCGRSGCHEDVTAQWASSAHRFSSFNNQWYRKSIEYLQEVGGVEKAKFCGGCHDPAVLLSGKMEQPVDSFLSSAAAHAGLACVACHSISTVKNTAGNGGYVLAYPELHDLATSDNPVIQFVHDQLIEMDPEPHRRTFLKPFMERQPAEFCSTCHKVHLDTPVNDYRWMRGFNTYDNWQASGVSGFGARSFYQPETPQTCVTCHMPELPSTDPGGAPDKIRDHRFLAANTALPVANRDASQLEATKLFLQADRLSIDIFGIEALTQRGQQFRGARSLGLVQANTAFADGEEVSEFSSGGATIEKRDVSGPLHEGQSIFEPGRQHRLDIVVRSRTVGHFFPSGTVDAQEAWLDVRVSTASGQVLVHSGNVVGLQVDSTAHFYRNRLIDAAGGVIDKRNANAARAAVYVNLIPPGAADVAHYLIDVPGDLQEEIIVEARLQYRKFTADYTAFSYGGHFNEPFDPATDSFERDDRTWRFETPDSSVSGEMKALPEVPIVTMASSTRRFGVVGQATIEATNASDLGDPIRAQSAAMRWNDYGIALLRNGDLKSAQYAFKQVTDLYPEYIDGWVNHARALVREGVYAEANRLLDRALDLEVDAYKAQYLKGIVAKSSGLYDEAQNWFKQVLARYPKDRVILNDLGRTLYLDGSLELAISQFDKVLEIDPEDLTAHYNLMLVYRALGDDVLLASHEQRYERFKIDESAAARARAYRQRHPADNNEANAIHSHR